MLFAGGAVFPATNSCLLPSLIFSPQSKLAVPRVRSSSRPCMKPDSSPVMSVATGGERTKKWDHNQSLRHQLGLGGFTEDGSSYKEKFIVRSYDVGVNKTITIQIIMSFLQDVACNHFLSAGYTIDDGFSTTHTMKKLNLILVLSRIHVEVYKYPTWNDVIEIETWFQVEGTIALRRNWILQDYSTGEVIGRGTGKWLLMNQETRRFHKVVDDIRDEVLVYTPRSPRLAFPDENKAWLEKIEKHIPSHYTKLGLEPRRSDLDMNKHLSNVTYVGWILESMPSHIIDNYEIQSLTIDYKRECVHGDIIDSLTSRESKEANDTAENIHKGILHFRHLLRLSRDGSETNWGRTIWRKKT